MTFESSLGATEVLNLLDEIVRDFGSDYEIEMCQYYRWDGEGELEGDYIEVVPEEHRVPVCIVGQVLDRLNLSFPTANSDSWSSVQDEYDFTEEANLILDDAQTAQDGRTNLSKRNWGAAVEFARRNYIDRNGGNA